MNRPSHLPPLPASHYVAFCLVYEKAKLDWCQISDGPATWRDVTEAVAERLDDVAMICHPSLGFYVEHIEKGRVYDVTRDVLAFIRDRMRERRDPYDALEDDPAFGVA